MDSPPKTKQTGWVWWAWLWWIWACCASLWAWWACLWAWCVPYLALAWMYIKTSLPIGEKDEDLIRWVREKVPSRPVSDLGCDLADGVTLCGLLEALVPGTCPRHDLLPLDQPEANLHIATRLASVFLGVTQDLSVAAGGGRNPRQKMVQFLRNVRYYALRRQVFGGPQVTAEAVAQTLGSYQVIARGMGLQMGVVGRRARFSLYLSSPTGLDLTVEVKNKGGDYCSHRITNRSSSRTSSLSKEKLKARHNIPLEYSVAGCEVRVAWIPLQQAHHTLSIIWQGQHVVGSPYKVVVDDSQHNSPARKCRILRPLLDSDTESEQDSFCTPRTSAVSRSDSLNKGDATGLGSFKAELGARRFVSILRRRVVRRIVHVGGEDVVLRGDESIGRSSRARQAFQRMRSPSYDSTEETDDFQSSRFSSSALSSRRASQQADGKVQIQCSLHSGDSPDEKKLHTLDCVAQRLEEAVGNGRSETERIMKDAVAKACVEGSTLPSQVMPTELQPSQNGQCVVEEALDRSKPHENKEVSESDGTCFDAEEPGALVIADFPKSDEGVVPADLQEESRIFKFDNSVEGDIPADLQEELETLECAGTLEGDIPADLQEEPETLECAGTVEGDIPADLQEELETLECAGTLEGDIPTDLQEEPETLECAGTVEGNIPADLLEEPEKLECAGTLEGDLPTDLQDEQKTSEFTETAEGDIPADLQDEWKTPAFTGTEEEDIPANLQDEAERSDFTDTHEGDVVPNLQDEQKETTDTAVSEVNVLDHKSQISSHGTLSKDETAGSLEDFDETCSTIMDMCDFIIEHSPKKEALKTVEVASRIIAYSFNDASDSSSLPTTDTSSQGLPVEEDLSYFKDEEEDDEVLESVVDDQGTVLNVSFGSSNQDDADGENTDTSEPLDGSVEVEATRDSVENVKEEIRMSCHDQRPLTIPSLIVHEEVAPSTTKSDVEETSKSDLAVADLEVATDMDYLHTIEEETEPSSMGDDDRWASELEPCEELPEESLYSSETMVKVSESGGAQGVAVSIEPSMKVAEVISDLLGQSEFIVRPDERMTESSKAMADVIHLLEPSQEMVEPYEENAELSASVVEPSEQIAGAANLIDHSHRRLKQLMYITKALLQTTEELPQSMEDLQTSEEIPQWTEELLEATEHLPQIDEESLKVNEPLPPTTERMPWTSKEHLETAEEVEQTKDPLLATEDLPPTIQERRRVTGKHLQTTEEQLKVTEQLLLAHGELPRTETHTAKAQPQEELPEYPNNLSEVETEEPEEYSDACETREDQPDVVRGTEEHVQVQYGSNCTVWRISGRSPDDRDGSENDLHPHKDSAMQQNLKMFRNLLGLSSQSPSPMLGETPHMMSSRVAQAQRLYESKNSQTIQSKERHDVPVESPDENLSSRPTKPAKDGQTSQDGKELAVPGFVSKFKSMFETRSLEEISYLQRKTLPDESESDTHATVTTDVVPDPATTNLINKDQLPEAVEKEPEPESFTTGSNTSHTTGDSVNKVRTDLENNVVTEKLKSPRKVQHMPVILPDIDILNQYRVDKTSDIPSRVPCDPSGESLEGVPQRDEMKVSVKDNRWMKAEQRQLPPARSVSPTLHTLQDKIKMSKATRIPYITYVRPSMIVLESDKRVSRLRSVFESSSQSHHRTPRRFSQKVKRFIVEGEDMQPLTTEKTDISSDVTPGDAEAELREDGMHSSQEDQFSETLETSASAAQGETFNNEPSSQVTGDSVPPFRDTNGQLVGDRIFLESGGLNHRPVLPDEGITTELPLPAEEEISGLDKPVDESYQDTSVIKTEGEFELQRKSQKLVVALANMEKDIKEMQMSVKRLNEHYPILLPDDEDLVGISASTDRDSVPLLKSSLDNPKQLISDDDTCCAANQDKEVDIPRGRVQLLAQRFNNAETGNPSLANDSLIDMTVAQSQDGSSEPANYEGEVGVSSKMVQKEMIEYHDSLQEQVPEVCKEAVDFRSSQAITVAKNEVEVVDLTSDTREDLAIFASETEVVDIDQGKPADVIDEEQAVEQESNLDADGVEEDLTKPVDEVEEDLTKPVDKVEQDLTKPVDEVEEDLTKPVDEVEEDLTKPVDEVEEDLTKPVDEVEQDLTKPVDEVEQDLIKPAGEVEEDLTKPVDEVEEDLTKPADEVEEDLTKPVDEVEEDLTKPVDEVEEDLTQPADEVEEDLTKPADEVEQDLIKPAGEVEEDLTKPVDEVEEDLTQPADQPQELYNPVICVEEQPVENANQLREESASHIDQEGSTRLADPLEKSSVFVNEFDEASAVLNDLPENSLKAFVNLQEPTVPVEQLQEPSKPVEHIQELTEPVEHFQEPVQPIEHSHEPIGPVEHIQVASESVDHIQEPSKPAEHIQKPFEYREHFQEPTESVQHPQEPSEPVEHIPEPCRPVEHLQEPVQSIEHFQGPEEPVERVHEQTGPVQHIYEPTGPVDRVQEPQEEPFVLANQAQESAISVDQVNEDQGVTASELQREPSIPFHQACEELLESPHEAQEKKAELDEAVEGLQESSEPLDEVEESYTVDQLQEESSATGNQMKDSGSDVQEELIPFTDERKDSSITLEAKLELRESVHVQQSLPGSLSKREESMEYLDALEELSSPVRVMKDLPSLLDVARNQSLLECVQEEPVLEAELQTARIRPSDAQDLLSDFDHPSEPLVPECLREEPVSYAPLPQEPSPPANSHKSPIPLNLSDESSASVSRMVETPSSDSLLEKSASPLRHLEDPAVPVDLEGPAASANRLDESVIPVSLAEELTDAPVDLQEPAASPDLLGEPSAFVGLPSELVAPDNLQEDPAVSVNLLEQPAAPVCHLEESITSINLLEGPIMSIEGSAASLDLLLQEPAPAAELQERPAVPFELQEESSAPADLQEPAKPMNLLADFLGEKLAASFNSLEEPVRNPLEETWESLNLMGESSASVNLLETPVESVCLEESSVPVNLLEAPVESVCLKEASGSVNLLETPVESVCLGESLAPVNLLEIPHESISPEKPSALVNLLDEPSAPVNLLESSAECSNLEETIVFHKPQEETGVSLNLMKSLNVLEFPDESDSLVEGTLPVTPSHLEEPLASSLLMEESNAILKSLDESPMPVPHPKEQKAPVDLLEESAVSVDLLEEPTEVRASGGPEEGSTEQTECFDHLKEPTTCSRLDGQSPASVDTVRTTESVKNEPHLSIQPEISELVDIPDEVKTHPDEDLCGVVQPSSRSGREISSSLLPCGVETTDVLQTNSATAELPKDSDMPPRQESTEMPHCELLVPADDHREMAESDSSDRVEISIPGLVVQSPTSESDLLDSDELGITITPDSDDLPLEDIVPDSNTYVCLQEEISFDLLAQQHTTDSSADGVPKCTDGESKPLPGDATTSSVHFDEQEQEPELMSLISESAGVPDSSSHREDSPVDLQKYGHMSHHFPTETDASHDILEEQVEELEEHRGSPWLMFTAISDYIRSRSPSPLSMFFSRAWPTTEDSDDEQSLPPHGQNRQEQLENIDRQEFPQRGNGILEDHSGGNWIPLSSLAADEASVECRIPHVSGITEQTAKPIESQSRISTSLHRSTEPPTSLVLTRVNIPVSGDAKTPQDETSEVESTESITSPTYETVTENLPNQMVSSGACVGRITLPDATPDCEEAPELPSDTCKDSRRDTENVTSDENSLVPETPEVSSSVAQRDISTSNDDIVDFMEDKTALADGHSKELIATEDEGETCAAASENASITVTQEGVCGSLLAGNGSGEADAPDLQKFEEQDESDSDNGDFSFGTEDTGNMFFVPQQMIEAQFTALKKGIKENAPLGVTVREQSHGVNDSKPTISQPVRTSSGDGTNIVAEKSQFTVTQPEEHTADDAGGETSSCGERAVGLEPEGHPGNSPKDERPGSEAFTDLLASETALGDEEEADEDSDDGDFTFGTEDTGDLLVPQQYIDAQLSTVKLRKEQERPQASVASGGAVADDGNLSELKHMTSSVQSHTPWISGSQDSLDGQRKKLPSSSSTGLTRKSYETQNTSAFSLLTHTPWNSMSQDSFDDKTQVSRLDLDTTELTRRLSEVQSWDSISQDSLDNQRERQRSFVSVDSLEQKIKTSEDQPSTAHPLQTHTSWSSMSQDSLDDQRQETLQSSHIAELAKRMSEVEPATVHAAQSRTFLNSMTQDSLEDGREDPLLLLENKELAGKLADIQPSTLRSRLTRTPWNSMAQDSLDDREEDPLLSLDSIELARRLSEIQPSALRSMLTRTPWNSMAQDSLDDRSEDPVPSLDSEELVKMLAEIQPSALRSMLTRTPWNSMAQDSLDDRKEDPVPPIDSTELATRFSEIQPTALRSMLTRTPWNSMAQDSLDDREADPAQSLDSIELARRLSEIQPSALRSMLTRTPWNSMAQDSLDDQSEDLFPGLDCAELARRIGEVRTMRQASEKDSSDKNLDQQPSQEHKGSSQDAGTNLVFPSAVELEPSTLSTKDNQISSPIINIITRPVEPDTPAGHESSCDSDSDDDMSVGPIKGCRPLVIPMTCSPSKSPISASDSDSSQSESDATTDEDDIEIAGSKPKSKFIKPARSHITKLHTIPELSEDEEDEAPPVRPPRLKKLSVSRLRYFEGPESPRSGASSPRASQRSPKIGKLAPEFFKKFEVDGEALSSRIKEDSEDHSKEVRSLPTERAPRSSDSASSSSSSGSDEDDGDQKITYGRCYFLGNLHKGPRCTRTNVGLNTAGLRGQTSPVDEENEVFDSVNEKETEVEKISQQEAEDHGRTTEPDMKETLISERNVNEEPKTVSESKTEELRSENKDKTETSENANAENTVEKDTPSEPEQASTVRETPQDTPSPQQAKPEPQASPSLTLQFLEENVDQASFYPPLETLLIPARAEPVTIGSPCPMKRANLSEPDEVVVKPQYVITLLGEESVLTDHTFAPPMESLLIPMLQGDADEEGPTACGSFQPPVLDNRQQGTVERTVQKCVEGHKLHTADEGLGLRSPSGEVKGDVVTDTVVDNLISLSPDLNSSLVSDSCTDNARPMWSDTLNKRSSEVIHSLTLDQPQDRRDKRESTEEVEFARAEKYLIKGTREIVEKKSIRENVTKDRESKEDKGARGSESAASVAGDPSQEAMSDPTPGDSTFCKDSRTTVEALKDLLTKTPLRTDGLTRSSSSGSHSEVVLTKEHLTFFQSGGLQRLASSFGVISSTEVAKGEMNRT
ncbi:LOW QUALITY PROTEIN: uncharacterized protein, partial [Panulirus ornatus]|uniref:LOW QUALITY PROTEIN: uncharacterized protein n=1 Tax=Panulirus ornatus TaxID=150431 RepID=UPI003A83B500